jgi:hypothetical protein
MEWSELLSQLEAFAEGRLPLAALRQWFTPFLADESVLSSRDPDVFFDLIFLFEDESLSEHTHFINARRLIRAARDVKAHATLSELIPLITDQDRLCTIIERNQTGIISRTSFISAISGSRYHPTLKQWLIHADPGLLEPFCTALSNENYRVVAAMTQMQQY